MLTRLDINDKLVTYNFTTTYFPLLLDGDDAVCNLFLSKKLLGLAPVNALDFRYGCQYSIR